MVANSAILFLALASIGHAGVVQRREHTASTESYCYTKMGTKAVHPVPTMRSTFTSHYTVTTILHTVPRTTRTALDVTKTITQTETLTDHTTTQETDTATVEEITTETKSITPDPTTITQTSWTTITKTSTTASSTTPALAEFTAVQDTIPGYIDWDNFEKRDVERRDIVGDIDNAPRSPVAQTNKHKSALRPMAGKHPVRVDCNILISEPEFVTTTKTAATTRTVTAKTKTQTTVSSEQTTVTRTETLGKASVTVTETKTSTTQTVLDQVSVQKTVSSTQTDWVVIPTNLPAMCTNRNLANAANATNAGGHSGPLTPATYSADNTNIDGFDYDFVSEAQDGYECCKACAMSPLCGQGQYADAYGCLVFFATSQDTCKIGRNSGVHMIDQKAGTTYPDQTTIFNGYCSKWTEVVWFSWFNG